MTSHERFTRMFRHQEADRIPIIDEPWGATLERWHSEGMPQDADFADYFDLDKIIKISVDNSPRFPVKVLEETDEYVITTTVWGATMKNWKHIASTPEFLDFKVKDRKSWEEAKELMISMPDRIPWDWLHKNYGEWRQKGYWLEAELWFGFDVTHSWTVGTERFLMAMVEDPEWCMDIFEHFLRINLEIMNIVWDAGYQFDAVRWPDDMGYKQHQFFSVDTYRELVKPFHKKAVDWAHEKGVLATLHSCGDINPFIPEFIDIGLDGLNPIEVKAGMDPIALKKSYGDKLLLHGGINAALWDNFDALEAQMRKIVPVMKESGGYIFSSDHSVPSCVSMEEFRRIVNLAKELGSY